MRIPVTTAVGTPKNWLLAALCVVVVLGFSFGILTLAGGGILIVAVILPLWIGLLVYTRRNRLATWLLATPIFIYSLLMAIGLVAQGIS